MINLLYNQKLSMDTPTIHQANFALQSVIQLYKSHAYAIYTVSYASSNFAES